MLRALLMYFHSKKGVFQCSLLPSLNVPCHCLGAPGDKLIVQCSTFLPPWFYTLYTLSYLCPVHTIEHGERLLSSQTPEVINANCCTAAREVADRPSQGHYQFYTSSLNRLQSGKSTIKALYLIQYLVFDLMPTKSRANNFLAWK